MASEHLSDQELWNAIKLDDQAAFKCLYDRYWEKAFVAAYYVIKDREVCMEIIHDIFVNLWTKRQHLDISFFNTYLTTSAHYRVYRYLETTKRNPLFQKEDLASISNYTGNAQTDDRLITRDLETQVENSLANLPKRCKEIFVLSRKEHLSNSEIADRLDISKRTVENQITHALHHLRVALKSFLSLLIYLSFY